MAGTTANRQLNLFSHTIAFSSRMADTAFRNTQVTVGVVYTSRGILSRRIGFDPRAVRMGFMVHEVALEQVSVGLLRPSPIHDPAE